MNTTAQADLRFMREALALAEQGWGATHPNPMVGAVIVENGEIVASGWHARDGAVHAEKAALAALGRKPAADATLYVTLEPCSTPGRTGACTDAIIAAGIRTLVIGTLDPNPVHGGKALPLLESQGICVRTGVLEKECRELNRIFNHWITTAKPLVAVKLALTLDGRMATASGHARWITGAEARADVMHWRRLFPAIAVGAGTVLADDPELTARSPEGIVWCPQRCVLDRSLRTLTGKSLARLYTDSYAERTLVFTGEKPPRERQKRLQDTAVQIVSLPNDSDTAWLHAFVAALAARQLTGVYIEPGPTLFSGLVAAGIIDFAWFYTAPKIVGDANAPGLILPNPALTMDQALTLNEPEMRCLGSAIRMSGKWPMAFGQ